MSAPRRGFGEDGSDVLAEIRELLTVALLPDLGPRCARELLKRGPVGGVLAHPEDHADLLSEPARRQLVSGAAARRAEEEVARAARSGLSLLGLGDPGYPGYLARIFDPPLVLYVRGRLEPEEGATSLAVVGSRAASPPGRALARRMARDLAAGGISIVSGLARGIDSAAHQGALEGGGRTIAVLGCGLDRVYPPENAKLATDVAASGAVVSEFPLGTPPLPGHFPRRNRLIAGLGRGVVVVEAAARSGALGTVRCALDEGREVMAVPGHPTSPGSEGVNALIRDGATLVRGASDVATELGFTLARRDPPAVEGQGLLELLRPGAPLSLEALRDRSGMAVPELLARLGALELLDRVERLPGPLFVRT
jgi:DNA processing protein